MSKKAVKLLNGPKKRKHKRRRCKSGFFACTQEEINDVVQMLSDKADINAANKYGETMLHEVYFQF